MDQFWAIPTIGAGVLHLLHDRSWRGDRMDRQDRSLQLQVGCFMKSESWNQLPIVTSYQACLKVCSCFFFVTHNSDIVHTRVVDLRVSILKSEQRFGRSWMWSTQVLPLNTQLSESRLWWTPADSHLLWLCPSQTCAGVVFSWRRCVGALSVWCLFRTSEMVEEAAFYELSQNM